MLLAHAAPFSSVHVAPSTCRQYSILPILVKQVQLWFAAFCRSEEQKTSKANKLIKGLEGVDTVKLTGSDSNKSSVKVIQSWLAWLPLVAIKSIAEVSHGHSLFALWGFSFIAFSIFLCKFIRFDIFWIFEKEDVYYLVKNIRFLVKLLCSCA